MKRSCLLAWNQMTFQKKKKFFFSIFIWCLRIFFEGVGGCSSRCQALVILISWKTSFISFNLYLLFFFCLIIAESFLVITSIAKARWMNCWTGSALYKYKVLYFIIFKNKLVKQLLSKTKFYIFFPSLLSPIFLLLIFKFLLKSIFFHGWLVSLNFISSNVNNWICKITYISESNLLSWYNY